MDQQAKCSLSMHQYLTWVSFYVLSASLPVYSLRKQQRMGSCSARLLLHSEPVNWRTRSEPANGGPVYLYVSFSLFKKQKQTKLLAAHYVRNTWKDCLREYHGGREQTLCLSLTKPWYNTEDE